jgi:organic hydroperoxide reductase OsmC/OhrA
VGILEKNSDGKLAITRVTLRPKITFAGSAPDPATLAQMHEQSHHDCFIASSVKTDVTVEPA